MKQVILIHGLPDYDEYYNSEWPSPSNAHFIPWVQREVLRRGVLCQALEMPHPYNPDYREHEAVLNQMSINGDTVLVGWSSGGGFLLRYFSEYKELRPKKIILLAPWLDPEKSLQVLNPETDYFDFVIDSGLPQRSHIDLIYSTDDEEITESVEIIKKNLPGIQEYVFSDKGHFTEPDLGSKEFPELVDIILN